MIWAEEEKRLRFFPSIIQRLHISSIFFFEPHSVGPMYFELIVKNEEYLASYDDVFVLLQMWMTFHIV